MGATEVPKFVNWEYVNQDDETVCGDTEELVWEEGTDTIGTYFTSILVSKITMRFLRGDYGQASNNGEEIVLEQIMFFEEEDYEETYSFEVEYIDNPCLGGLTAPAAGSLDSTIIITRED